MTTEAKIRPWLLIVLLAVIIIGGGFTYWYSYANKNKITLTPSPTPTISTAKKSLSPSPNVSPTSPVTASDESLLMALCESNYPGAICGVEKIDGNYAVGNFGSNGGGAVWYAKKLNNTWTMIIDGIQDIPPCSQTSDFPKSIVPTCAQ